MCPHIPSLSTRNWKITETKRASSGPGRSVNLRDAGTVCFFRASRRTQTGSVHVRLQEIGVVRHIGHCSRDLSGTAHVRVANKVVASGRTMFEVSCWWMSVQNNWKTVTSSRCHLLTYKAVAEHPAKERTLLSSCHRRSQSHKAFLGQPRQF